MKNYECVILGGGITGTCLFSDLVRKGVKTALLESGEDVSLGATKANSGIIHAGYDCAENTLKARYNVRGNKMYRSMAKRLGEKFCNTGSLVVGDKDSFPQLQALLNRGKANSVKKMKILSKQELSKIEPNLADNIEYGLFAKTAGIISPYNMAIALCEEGVINGGNLYLNYKTISIKATKNGFEISNGKIDIFSRFLINCAGAGVNEINALIGDEKLDVHLTKGEYILLDKNEGGLVNRPIFPLPTKAGKGILVAPTAAGNIICGPTAVDIPEFDTSVSPDSIFNIKITTQKMIKGINFRKAIKLYAGVRVKIGDDFVVGFSKNIQNYYLVAGICSPGLTSAPAIAEKVVEDLMARGAKSEKIKVQKRKPYTNILKMKESQLEKLINKNPKYGRIICRCEKISEGEILEVLGGPIRPLTVEGVKRRIRPTMGRCQGSFCLPVMIKLMSKYYKVDAKDIIDRGNASIVVGDIKEGGLYDGI